MTPKTSEISNFYFKNFPNTNRYRFWSAFRAYTPEPPSDDFIMFKMRDYWCWGVNGDVDEVNQWRKLSSKQAGTGMRGVPRKIELFEQVWPTPTVMRNLEKHRSEIMHIVELFEKGKTVVAISAQLHIPKHMITVRKQQYQKYHDYLLDTTTEPA